jgi:hypothetical protein
VSFFEELDIYEVPEEHKVEKEKKKLKKRTKQIITVKLDEKYIEKLKQDKVMQTSGETDIMIKTRDGKIQHERYYGRRLEALNIALSIKRENPENTVKLIVK